MKMLPWIKNYYAGLTAEQKNRLIQLSQTIVKHVMSPTAVKVALRALGDVIKEFPFISDDVRIAYDTLQEAGYNEICYSEMEVLEAYFKQFSGLELPKREEPTQSAVAVHKVREVAKHSPEVDDKNIQIGSRLIAKNDAYGEVEVEVMDVTDVSYIVRYMKGRRLIISRWRIPKNSPRILRVIE